MRFNEGDLIKHEDDPNYVFRITEAVDPDGYRLAQIEPEPSTISGWYSEFELSDFVAAVEAPW